MNRHTPGPWSYEEDGGGSCFAFEVRQPRTEGGPRGIALVYGNASDDGAPTLEDTENARLMAAAPDLLAACEAVLNYLEDGTPTDERSDAENSAIIQLAHAIRAAGGVLPSEYTRSL